MAKNASKPSALLKARKSSSSTRIDLEANDASSRHAKQTKKNAKRSGRPLHPLTDDWKTFKNLSEAEINARALADADALPTDRAFWKNAVIVQRTKKLPVTVRLDTDVLAWFRARGKGYQTHINAVLRSYMQAHRR